MAYRQTRAPLLPLTEIEAERLAIRRAKMHGHDHAQAIEAANHVATLARESARLLQFVRR